MTQAHRDFALFALLAGLAIGLTVWLLSMGNGALPDCPNGWREVRTERSVKCFNPQYDHPPASVQSSEQPRRR